MRSFLRGAMYGFGILAACAMFLYGWRLLMHPVLPSCDGLKALADSHMQAVSACANAPGCQFTSESIRVALEAKAAAESCK